MLIAKMSRRRLLKMTVVGGVLAAGVAAVPMAYAATTPPTGFVKICKAGATADKRRAVKAAHEKPAAKTKAKDKKEVAVGTVEIFKGKDGYRFRIKNVDGKTIGMSQRGHDSKDEVVKDLDEIKATFGKRIQGDVGRSPIADHELALPNGTIAGVLRQAIVRCLANRAKLETDGDELIWERENLTLVQDVAAIEARAESIRLTATFGNVTIELGSSKPALHMGRGPENEFVIPDPLASRVHARIEYRRDRFVLIDQSLNGTYVQMQGGPETVLRRDEIVLDASGLIGLGKSTAAQQQLCVRFIVQRGSQVAERALFRKRSVR